MAGGAPDGFVPPPYPHDRLADLRTVADAVPGGIIDASVGTPVDPTPEVVVRAATAALRDATGYPATIGSPAFREAAAAWLHRRFAVDVGADAVLACVGTKELVAGLPRLLSLRDPARDTVLYPALSYPTYAMGATLAGLRAVPVPVDDAWRLDVTAVDPDDAARALLLWCNDPANPTGAGASAAQLADTVAWARSYGIFVASDECYAEFTCADDGTPTAPVTALAGNHEGVVAVHSLSKRSNMAGFRIGFVAGDRELVGYLGEVRKHAGMMSAAPVQAAAVAALGDDAHVGEQRDRYARRRRSALPAFEAFGLVHDGGPSTFYLWLRAGSGDPIDGWSLAARLADAGVLVAPGDLYGAAGADHVRLALTLTDDQVQRMVEQLAGEDGEVSGLEKRIGELWTHRDDLASFTSEDEARRVVDEAIDLLDRGEARVAEIVDDEVVVHEWCKQAILLLFRLAKMETIELGPFEYADKIPLKHGYEAAKVRAVPGSSARWGSYLAPGVILMPSYVNIGARVGEGTMVDTWATVGSCAQIGARVHLSGGVGIGGVLEPPQAAPVIIGDECTIGSRSMITQGARVGEGSVLGEGVILNPGIPVIDAATGDEVGRGVVPSWCIVVQAMRPRSFPGGEYHLPCALIIRRLTEGERADKAKLNDILRDHGIAT